MGKEFRISESVIRTNLIGFLESLTCYSYESGASTNDPRFKEHIKSFITYLGHLRKVGADVTPFEERYFKIMGIVEENTRNKEKRVNPNGEATIFRVQRTLDIMGWKKQYVRKKNRIIGRLL